MWKLNKPSLRKATGKDIDELTSHCNALDDNDKPVLKSLYKIYDSQGGIVFNNQLNIIATNKAKAIHGQYDKTHSGEKLDYIRKELIKDVDLCPYCSINHVSHLDHFMPKSQYPALAVCRMNLVPLCGVCNQKKTDDDFKLYTHAYYDTFPSVPFLIANINILKLRFVVKYNFDSAAINDIALETKLNHQATKTELWDRLKKETNNFINTLCCSCDVIDTLALTIWLGRRLSNYELIFGLNDWRCAIIRGLLACKKLNVDVVNNYKVNPKKVNGGAGA